MMPLLDNLRWLESMHGHLGVLAMAALLHPALLLWSGKPLSRNGKLALGASVALVSLAFALGLWIYPAYREQVKPALFMADVSAGLAFETKEHLAWVSLVSAITAGVAGLAAPPKAANVRRIAARVFLASAAACALAAALGTWVAAVRSF
jgi:hypothetical protein